MPEREDFLRRELVEELRRVEAMIRQAPTPEKKIFYFSAAYGITGRTFKYAFSEDVLISDIILQNAYNMLNEHAKALSSVDNVIANPVLFDKICDGLRDLANAFESGGNVLDPLKNIATAGFTATGPGYYLLKKGAITL
jgi:S-adenosylmethionine synthetase